jgi:hypothetical protein
MADDALASERVRAAMRAAWDDSQPDDPDHRHEEGGYITQLADGSYDAVRWPRGAGAWIAPPPRTADGRYQGHTVVGEFHTHPNPAIDERGRRWQESPCPGDIAGIRSENYPGDSFVIGAINMYRVGNDGRESCLGGRTAILDQPGTLP